MTKKRRGFTLFEMLIIIAVLGLLSVTMIFSTLEATASAEANNVINNMILLKTATLMWYKENTSRIVPDTSEGYKIKADGTLKTFNEFIEEHGSEIAKYIDKKYIDNKDFIKSSSNNNTGDYSLLAFSTTVNKKKHKQWYVCYNLGTTSSTSDMEAINIKMKPKIAGRAKSLGLSATTKTDTSPSKTYTNQKFACMLVLDLPFQN